MVRRSRSRRRIRQGRAATGDTIMLGRRPYRVEVTAESAKAPEHLRNLPRYILHGPRGARYSTMRNVNHPHQMFVINDKSFLKGNAFEGIWLTDEGGTLRVIR
jgi:hypothetical protein